MNKDVVTEFVKRLEEERYSLEYHGFTNEPRIRKGYTINPQDSLYIEGDDIQCANDLQRDELIAFYDKFEEEFSFRTVDDSEFLQGVYNTLIDIFKEILDSFKENECQEFDSDLVCALHNIMQLSWLEVARNIYGCNIFDENIDPVEILNKTSERYNNDIDSYRTPMILWEIKKNLVLHEIFNMKLNRALVLFFALDLFEDEEYIYDVNIGWLLQYYDNKGDFSPNTVKRELSNKKKGNKLFLSKKAEKGYALPIDSKFDKEQLSKIYNYFINMHIIDRNTSLAQFLYCFNEDDEFVFTEKIIWKESTLKLASFINYVKSESENCHWVKTTTLFLNRHKKDLNRVVLRNSLRTSYYSNGEEWVRMKVARACGLN